MNVYLTQSFLPERRKEFLSWSKTFMVTSKFICFWYGRKITNFFFSVLRDNVCHYPITYNGKFFIGCYFQRAQILLSIEKVSCHRQTERNSIDQMNRRYHYRIRKTRGPNIEPCGITQDLTLEMYWPTCNLCCLPSIFKICAKHKYQLYFSCRSVPICPIEYHGLLYQRLY